MKNLTQSRASHRFIVVLLTLVVTLAMTITSFADVTVTKEWEDGLTGTAASSREAPTVNLEGATPYEQLLNIFYPVGCCFTTLDPSFNPNDAWGGTWQKLPAGMNVIQAGGSYQFGSTGGEATHYHEYGFIYPAYYQDITFEGDAYGALDLQKGPTATKPHTHQSSTTYNMNSGNVAGTVSRTGNLDTSMGTTTSGSNMQPYIAGNIWKRTA